MTLSFSQFFNLTSTQERYKFALTNIYEQLEPSHCFIGKFIDDDSKVKTLMYLHEGKLVDNITYSLAGSPCFDAKNSESVCCVNTGLQTLYNEDELLSLLGISSYLAVTLRALDHSPIGILVCMFDHEKSVSTESKLWFKELSHLVATELNHNLVLSKQDTLLKQLAKGEQVTDLCTWTWNIKQDSHQFSEQLSRLLDLSDQPLSLKSLLTSLIEPDQKRLNEALSLIRANQKSQLDIQVSHLGRDNQHGLFRIIGHVENDTRNFGEPIFTGTIQDVSYVWALNKQLELTNVVFEHSTEGIMITNQHNKVIMVNKAFETLTGYSSSELIGKDPSILSSGRQDKAFYEAMWQALSKQGYWKGEIYNRRKNGQIYPEELTLTAVTDDEGEITNYVAIFRDISEWKINEQRLIFYANHEPLTALLNRRSFMQKLEHKVAAAERSNLFLLFIGLDRFKDVNDLFGPSIGDKVLVCVAKRLKANLNKDSLVARYGGDEFAILVDNQTQDSALKIAKDVSLQLSMPYVFNDITIELTVSTGVAQFKAKQKLSAANFLKNAAYALNSVKKTAKGQIALHDEMLQSAHLNKIRLRDKLKRALKARELTVHYQPIINTYTGQIEKFEALVRWFDNDYGVVSPGSFIPIAEEFGLIHLVGQYVLEQSCRDLAVVHALGFKEIGFSINRSVNEFMTTNNQAELITQAIEGAELPYDAITIEVTESIATNKYTWKTLNRLREFGVKISLDDFCTGYSSLSNLIENQVDYLKIDKSFVDSLVTDKNKQTLIDCLINLSQRLNITVIAEGVETQEQLNALTRFGCRHIQGYYFSPAKPIDECISMLQTNQQNEFDVISSNLY
ncbi:putative bifunctional diguanylate cyclase/phosphodiesterase (plasmid) [Pseudoalteromonas sp. T1lg65]|uniref:putative bifunctional diguanylate cyclase/phosphodiesterase n=1 Tax=Pseudoalteromonas sp. T1lg65 TaxID=2077101 RepID=UPI003F7A347C